MTHPTPSETLLSRRTVLRTTGAATALGVLGLPALGGSAAAAPTETLYLIENAGNAGDGQTPATDNGPFLFEVTLNNGTAALTDLAAVPDRIDAGHIAATPDGAFVYVVDRDSGRIETYDVAAGTFSSAGQIAGHPGGVVLVAFSPDGTLYMASNSTDTLYTVTDLETAPTATEVGYTGIDVQGADLAFTADGTLYLYSNAEGSGTLFTVDTDTGAATPVGETGVGLTGLAVRLDGTGDLVGSATRPDDEIIVFSKTDGSIVDRFAMYRNDEPYPYDFGDMSVGRLVVCETTADLCAAQDIPVGSVSIAQVGDTYEVTFEMDPDAGWLLYETHLDIGDHYEDFHTNNAGNPRVGQFDRSEDHDGVTSYTYTIAPGDPALADVAPTADTLYVAAHAVVRPVDGCVDFGALEPGSSVEGLGTVTPALDIQSGYSDGSVLVSTDGSDPFFYGSDERDGVGGGRKNGCLDPAGFADVVATDASGSNRPHKYRFTVKADVQLSEFTLRMLDFGDYNPSRNTHHYARMAAYDADGTLVDEHELEYWTNGTVNPTGWSWTDPADGGTLGGNLQDAGDACDAAEGDPGNWVWTVTGDGIVRVELECGDGHDPNIAFTDLCYTAQDETAWVCDGLPFDGRNWATYFTHERCNPEATE